MNRYIKIGLFAMAVAACFSMGYATISEAKFGRKQHHGYFKNKVENYGPRIYNTGMHVSNVDAFINRVKNKLNNSAHARTGSSFIIQTMLGTGVANRNHTPTQKQVDTWEEQVRYADKQGWIRWNRMYHYNQFNTYYQNARDDAAWYTESDTQPAILFYNGQGKVVYALKRSCANPVKYTANGLVNAPDDWRFTGYSKVKGYDRSQRNSPYIDRQTRLTVLPGDTVTFSHFITNHGSDTGRTTYTAWRHPNEGNPRSSWTVAPDKPSSGAPPHANPGTINVGAGDSVRVNWNRFTIPNSADPEDIFCQHVRVNDRASDDGRLLDELDEQACAVVGYDFELKPSVSASDTTVQRGDSVRFDYNMNNSGRTRSEQAQWTVQEIVFGPSESPGSIGERNDSDCGFYLSRGANSCTTVKNGQRSFNPGNTDLGNDNVAMNYPVGSTVCRILTVAPPTQFASPRNTWSAPSCVTIAKLPTVHFMGGDIAVGNPFASEQPNCTLQNNTGNIYTHTSDSNNGSVTEYAAFVRGIIEFQQAAASGFGTASQPATNQLNVQQLGFANTGSDVGNFGTNRCMTDYYAKYSAEISPQASPGSRSFGGSTTVHYNGDLTIRASSIQNGANILVIVDGDVTINGNVSYSNNYGSTSAIPSFAVIARGDIRIRDDVTQLDGVYSSKGQIDTCYNGPAQLTIHVCNQQLVINGAILTDQLALRRTFGATEPNESEPAELFNYTTELFFNNVLADEPEGRVETVEQRDLPPRY